MLECLILVVVQYAVDIAILIFYTPTRSQANVFYKNYFKKFKIFASTVVFKFQIKAESKNIQHRLLILVLLSNLQKFVGVFDFFILIMLLKYKIIPVAI